MSGHGARTHEAGRAAETLAALWLRLKGYRIVAKRFRAGVGEVDLIAFKRPPRFGRKAGLSGGAGVLAFVEVKRRDSIAAAAESVGARQKQRIARAAEAFVKRNPAYDGAVLRFDAVLIAPGQRPHHIADAWRP